MPVRVYAALRLALILGLALAPLASGTQALARTASADGGDTTSVRLPAAWAPAIAHGRATRLGTYAQDAMLDVAIPLRPRDPAGLSAFAQAVSDPQSPLYRHYLSDAQVQQRYGPDPAAASAVAAWLHGHGVSNVAADPGAVSFRAPARVVGALFGATIASWRLPSGRVIYGLDQAPAVPQSLDGSIATIIGLDDEAQLRPRLSGPSSAHAAIRPSIPGQGPGGGFTPTELRNAYDTASLIAGGTDGSGQTIDLFELDGYNPDNVATYDAQYGLNGSHVTPYSCATNPGGSMSCAANSIMPLGDPFAEAEVESDIEVAQAMAPGAAIHVYQTSNDAADILNLWQHILSAGDAHIASTSWGLCELDQAPSNEQALDVLFQRAVASGIGIYAATGDNGNLDCLEDAGSPHALMPSVDNPASDPNVTAVGGTKLLMNGTDSGYGGETVWNDVDVQPDLGAGGGGGVSTLFQAPAYQGGLTPPQLNGASGRMVPDVSANADIYSGYSVYVVGADQYGHPLPPSWSYAGGTSLAAPLWAATMALADQALARSGQSPLGFANPTLYSLAKGPTYNNLFHDVTQGNNDVNPTDTTPAYVSAPGYDLASGWGSMDGAALVAALAGPTPPPPTSSPTLTASATPACASGNTPAASPTLTPTSTPTANPTDTAITTQTDTPAAPSTDTATLVPPCTPTANPTSTATPPATSTPFPPAPTSTNTPIPPPPPTNTPAPRPTLTNTPVPPAPPTSTPVPPAPPNTNTSVLPASSTTQAPSPASPTATVAAPPRLPTETHGSATSSNLTRGLARAPVPPLSFHLAGHSVDSGGALSLRLRTAARAYVSVVLQVTTTKVTPTGNGKHRKRTTRTIVLYRATLNGTADKLGQFTGRLRVTYKPARPAQAVLAVTVRAGHRSTTRTVRVTIQPPRPHVAVAHRRHRLGSVVAASYNVPNSRMAWVRPPAAPRRRGLKAQPTQLSAATLPGA